MDDTAILSPADGYICYIRRIHPGEEVFSIKKGRKIFLNDLMFIDDKEIVNTSGWLIGVMMTIFDMHYNTAPISGHIKKINHGFPSDIKANKDMLSTEIHLILNKQSEWNNAEYLPVNERASYIISNPVQSIYVTQIADRWVRKIVTIKDNQKIKQGDIFGLIKMGSQVDIFVPDEQELFDVCVKVRQRVKAGITKLLIKNE